MCNNNDIKQSLVEYLEGVFTGYEIGTGEKAPSRTEIEYLIKGFYNFLEYKDYKSYKYILEMLLDNFYDEKLYFKEFVKYVFSYYLAEIVSFTEENEQTVYNIFNEYDFIINNDLEQTLKFFIKVLDSLNLNKEKSNFELLDITKVNKQEFIIEVVKIAKMIYNLQPTF